MIPPPFAAIKFAPPSPDPRGVRRHSGRSPAKSYDEPGDRREFPAPLPCARRGGRKWEVVVVEDVNFRRRKTMQNM